MSKGFLVSIRQICNYGRTRLATRQFPSVKVQFPDRARLGYLPAGLYYLLVDGIRSPQFSLQEKRLPVSGLNIPSPMQMAAVESSGGGGVVRGDGRVVINKQNLYRELQDISKEKMFFTAEEVAWLVETKYRAPLNKISGFLSELSAEGKLKVVDERFYCLVSVDVEKDKGELDRAKQRAAGTFGAFNTAIDARIGELEGCRSIQEMWTILTSHEDYGHRALLGWRGVYLFLLTEQGLLKQECYTSLRENSYRIAGKPKGVMKSVLEGDKDTYRVEIKDDLSSTLEAFQRAGFAEVDAQWVEDTVLKYGIGTIELLNLTDQEGKTVGVLLLRDPIYFGKENQNEADEHLIRLAKAIGKAIKRINEQQFIIGAATPRAGELLTEDLLYRPPKDRVPYPRNAQEFNEMLGRLLDERGVFPGDSEPLMIAVKGERFFSPPAKDTSHVRMKRKGQIFRAEDFCPRDYAQGRENGLIFIADLISQIASFDLYAVIGCSYERGPYYEKRFFGSDRVPFVWAGDWPVSFAALQGYRMKINGEDLFYAFIHFVMTMGKFQRYGLTSYSGREAVSSLFYQNLWPGSHVPNLMYDRAGALKDYRLKMWVAAHSGRLSAFRAFVRSFGSVPAMLENDKIGEAIILNAHEKITPGKDRGKRNLTFLGRTTANERRIFVAKDEGVYPEENRYPIDQGGKVILPEFEQALPLSTIEPWHKAIGGDTGIGEGNGLYFVGLLTPFEIGAAKFSETSKERSSIRKIGDKIRNKLLAR